MKSDLLKYLLVRGLPIPYMNIQINQPTIKDLDEMYINYDSFRFIYCASKDFLQFDNGESIDDFKNYSYFQTIFKLKNKVYLQTLLLSLVFFLKVKVDNIGVHMSAMQIDINNDEGKLVIKIDNSNFEEFSELIRLICCCEKMEPEGKKKLKTVKYKDPSVQKIYEDLIKHNEKLEERKKKENTFTMADMIGSICINEKTKYKFEDLENLTVWKLHYVYNGMFIRESNEFTKMQYCSYKFSFEQTPNFNWIKETKVKLPESMLQE